MSFLDDLGPNNRGSLLLLGFIIFLITLILWNPSDIKKLGEKKSIQVPPIQNQLPESPKGPNGQLRRVSHVERGGEFIEDIFFIGDNEVARQKIEKGAMVNHQGQNITGAVKFFNELDQTYGEADYLNNLRSGLSKTYFGNGKIMLEEYYSRGKILRSKEYYPDGSTRFVSDLDEALKCPGEKEVGVAKLYYPTGKMKYEWNLTWRQKGGFKKTYNTDGSLRYVAWFNDRCQKIKEEYPGTITVN